MSAFSQASHQPKKLRGLASETSCLFSFIPSFIFFVSLHLDYVYDNGLE